PEGVGRSGGGAGLVGPKPVPQRTIVSPGLAGVVVTPASKNPAGAYHFNPVPSVATAYFPQGKNAGENCCNATLKGALVPLPLLTTTFTSPMAAPAGATIFSCCGLV